MPAPKSVVDLFERFKRHEPSYKSSTYNETQLRREFADPFFEALGWDVNNSRGYAENYKEVVHEDSVRIDGTPRSPDYSFRIGGVRKFFVETKKPSINLKDDPSPAYQLRRYAWSAKLPVSILTDFEEFVVYDTRLRPKEGDKASVARIEYLRGDEILTHWDERVAGRFSREAVLRGDFDRFAGPTGKRRGTAEVDEIFLKEIEGWRTALARVLALRNPELTVRELNFAVQITIDRIVFLRIAEDRGLEEQGRLLEIAGKKDAYRELLSVFRLADDRYNSGLFHFRDERTRRQADELTPRLRIDDKTLREIVESLYYPKSPYEFSVLPADILGQVYERFLGKVIRLTPAHQAVVEEKPEVRKAGGVYYTPSYVVRHIVRQAVATQLKGKSPRQIGKFRVLDPACGSGSFLLEAYQLLLDWHLEWYVADGAEKWARARQPRLRRDGASWRLTTPERKRVLVSHVFGVDVDAQAVEVTKLSLLLKVLEGETNASIGQIELVRERALPDLDLNIKCGNSLVGTDLLLDEQFSLLGEQDDGINAFDWHEEFKDAFANGGFDAVVGNPPYVLLQDKLRDNRLLSYYRETYTVAAYKVDTYHLFIERGLSLAKKGGVVAMITPSNFLTNNYLVSLRRMLLTDARLVELMIVDGGVFEGISVDNAIFACEVGEKTGKAIEITHAVPGNGTFAIGARQSIGTKAALADPHVLFTGSMDRKTTDLWRKIESKSAKLGTFADVNFGKQLRDRKRFQRDVIEVATIDEVPRGYRPCYTGRDVRRYAVTWNHLACLNKEEARSGGCWDAEKQDAKMKLLTKQIGRVPEFGMDTAGFQCLNTMFMVNVRDGAIDPYVLLAQLNSRVCRAVWLDRYFDQRRTFPKIKGTYLKELPIIAIADASAEGRASAKRLRKLAERAIKERKRVKSAKASVDDAQSERLLGPIERAIDAELYKLYGLTTEEIATIEGIATAK